VTTPDVERFRAAYLRNTELLNHGDQEAAFAWLRNSHHDDTQQ
jgi:hypothetical protein